MMKCEECGLPIDDSNDGFGASPMELDGKDFCGVQCLTEFADRVSRSAIELIPAVNLQEALRMRQTFR